MQRTRARHIEYRHQVWEYIADILDAYFHYEKLYIVGEHLGVSLPDLELKTLVLEEWEIATIIAEMKPTCPHPEKPE